MSVLTSRHVLRYQAYPGARLRAHKRTAFRDLAGQRIRRMLNFRAYGDTEACSCEADWYEDGRLVSTGSCAAHEWTRSIDGQNHMGEIVGRYARMLAHLDRNGRLGSDPAMSESGRLPHTPARYRERFAADDGDDSVPF